MYQEMRDICTLKVKKKFINKLMFQCMGLNYILEPGCQFYCIPPCLDLPRILTIDNIEQDENDYAIVSFLEIKDTSIMGSYDGKHLIMPAKSANNLEKIEDRSYIDWTLHDIKSKHSYKIVDILQMPSQMLFTLSINSVSSNTDFVDVPICNDFIVEEDDVKKILIVDLPENYIDELIEVSEH